MSNREPGPDAKILIDAKKLIENPENWTRFAEHKTYQTGHLWWKKTLHKYCAVGAIRAATKAAGRFDHFDFERRYFEARGVRIMVVNDCVGSHQDVLAEFDRAISMALAKGA